jgi:hypothetical protein
MKQNPPYFSRLFKKETGDKSEVIQESTFELVSKPDALRL